MTTLTNAELVTLEIKEQQAQAKQIGYWQIYSWLADIIEAKGVSRTDPTILWLRGATEANAFRGAFSSLIQTYTAKQYQLRYDEELTPQMMRPASDGVAQNLLDDLLGRNAPNWPKGEVPSISRIAFADARAVGEKLFNRDLFDSAAELQQNSAWSGALLFSALGSDQTNRLIFTGNPQALDTLSDLRDVIYAYESIIAGLQAAWSAFSFIGGDPIQRGRDMAITGNTLAAFLTSSGSVSEINAAIGRLINGPVGSVFQLIYSIGSTRFLDMIRGAEKGQSLIGATTDANFTANANAFFGNLTPAQLQSLQVKLLPTDASSLASMAKTDVNTRAALAALSSVSVQVSATVAQRFTLVDPVIGQGSITDQWINDRAKIQAAFMLYWKRAETDGVLSVTDTGVGLSFWQNGDTLIVVEGAGLAATQQLTIDGIDFGVLPSALRYFGNDADNTRSGGNADDHLYGGAGNDILQGQGGSDYLEGNSGSNVLDGGDGNDNLLGGIDNDTLDGGLGNDTLNGGRGLDTYKFFTSADESGKDVIIDADGSGLITADDVPLNGVGATKVGEGVWRSADRRYTYTLVSASATQKNLIISIADISISDGSERISERIIVRDWTESRSVGITLSDVSTPPTFSQTFTGDFNKVISGTTYTVTPYGYASAGFLANAADVIAGDITNDHLQGLGGNDALAGGAGADVIDGGDGSDVIQGGTGADTLNGGAGADFIYGSASGVLDRPVNTTFTMPSFTGIELARGFDWIAYDPPGLDANGIDIYRIAGVGSTMPNGELDSNYIDAGAGNDRVLAGSGTDVVHGGLDDDTIHGMAGSDMLFGDDGNDMIDGDGTPLEYSNFTPTDAHGNDILDGGAGNDQLSGQGGDDELFGGLDDDNLWGDDTNATDTPNAIHGKDYLDGGDGIDYLEGGGNSDTLFGGLGNDRLFGDGSVTNVAIAFQGADLLDGGEGDDGLTGGGGNDTLFGGAGADVVWGDDIESRVPATIHGNDYVDGGLGADSIFGAGGNDTLFGGDGNDQLSGDASAEYLAAASHGSDYLDGGEGNDIVDGNDGADTLLGAAGDDTLHGDNGNDVLTGGAGTDLMEGGDGDDTYIIEVGEAALHPSGLAEGIVDSDGMDTVALNGFTANGLRMGGNGNTDLTLNDGADQWIVVEGGLTGSVDTYLVGGASYSFSELVGRLSDVVLAGTDALGRQAALGGRADDAITTTSSLSIISGGYGNDTLSSFGGGNTYRYSQGDGSDLIHDGGGFVSTNSILPSSKLVFGSGVSASAIQLDVATNRLVIYVGDRSNGDSIQIDGFDVANALAALPIDSFSFLDGASLTTAQLVARGFDHAGSSLGSIEVGTNVDDRFLATAGNDSLSGGAGADVYRFGLGAGLDVIDDGDVSSSVDSLVINPGWVAADVGLGRSGDDLVVRLISSQNDILTIKRQFTGQGVEQIVFSDGTIWKNAEIQARLTNALTDVADAYTGSAIADWIDAKGGNDTVSGQGGDDVIFGGDGADTLIGDAGNDTLIGGAGNDTLRGSVGSDVYMFERGTGQDVIDLSTGVSTDVDEIHVGATLLPSDVGLIVDSSGTVARLTIKGTTDSIWFNQPGGNIANIKLISFADGTSWTRTQWLQRALDDLATAGNDTITGYDSNPNLIRGLGGNDSLIGGSGNDTLDGGAGTDVLLGQSGDDWLRNGETMDGGMGNDTYDATAQSGSFTVSEASGSPASGTDTIILHADFKPAAVLVQRRFNSSTLGSDDLAITAPGIGGLIVAKFFLNQSSDYKIESFQFSDGTNWSVADIFARLNTSQFTNGNDVISGFRWDDTLNGLGGNDSIWADQGNDTLAGGIGNDTLDGYLGDDTYRFGRGDGLDQVMESGGVDVVSLGAGITSTDIGLFKLESDLILVVDQGPTQLTVSGHFSSPSTQIDRIAFADGTIWDATAIQARTTVGSANAMTGTTGNDTFVVDNPGDTITEGASQGTDTVQSGINYWLGVNLENLVLTGSLNTKGTGNELNNAITGNSGNNTLDGKLGADTMAGGAGDDVYYVGLSDGDVVVEQVNNGTDLVISDGSFTLPSNIENLTLTPIYWQPAAFSAIGNALDNTITSNSSGRSDTIDGGVGADTMINNGGHVTFFVDNPGDSIISSSSVSTDTVISSIDYTLGASLEQLRLAGSATHGIGNSSDNWMVGGANGDTLEGRAGNDTFYADIDYSSAIGFVYNSAGADTLIGGLGNDIYYVDIGPASRDTIIEQIAEGIDTVFISGNVRTYDASEFVNIEKMTLREASGSSGLIGNADANTLTGNTYSNALDGGVGDDYIIDGPNKINGSDTMLGGIGNDSLLSWDGFDLLDGGAGNDSIQLMTNSLSAVNFGRDYGQDILYAQGSTSGWGRSVRFNADVSVSDVRLGRNGADLIVSLTGNAATLTVAGFFVDAASWQASGNIGSFTFPDGMTLSAATLALYASNGSNQATVGDDVLIGTEAGDSFIGLAGNDLIIGSGGDDTLQGSTGNDTLNGGIGNDFYVFARGDGADFLTDSAGVDQLTLAAGISPGDLAVTSSGIDLLVAVKSTADSVTLANAMLIDVNPTIEAVKFADGTVWTIGDMRNEAGRINGTAGADNLVGTSSGDRIFGLAGNDTLSGGEGADSLDGGIGTDSMVGGAGNDLYFVDVSTDVVTEAVSAGTDTVRSAVTLTLATNVENLILIEAATINGTGNTMPNTLTGNAAANALNGGTGADTMAGGGGNDTYTVDNIGDVVNEETNEGTDAVSSSVTYTLGSNVENLTLTGTGLFSGTGNTLANVLTGNSGANTLTGLEGDDTLNGGTGNDTMRGGAGNDVYVVNIATDVVTELTGEGTDTVQSTVTLTLSTNVENLLLTGTGLISGTGNTQANVLTGNSSANTLSGLAGDDTLDGGTGNDTMRGGAGNDVYFVNVATDVVTEVAGEGTDTVQSAVTLTLSTNVENLVLTGTGLITGTGTTLANTLTGNSGNNTLTGLAGNDTLNGGAGTDILIGGTGADTYQFGVGSGVDTVQENDSTASVVDGVSLSGSLTQASLQFSQVGNNLEMLIAGGTDKMIFKDWYLGSAFHVERFSFSNGSVLTDTQAQGLVGAMAAFAAPAAASTSLDSTMTSSTTMRIGIAVSGLL